MGREVWRGGRWMVVCVLFVGWTAGGGVATSGKHCVGGHLAILCEGTQPVVQKRSHPAVQRGALHRKRTAMDHRTPEFGCGLVLRDGEFFGGHGHGAHDNTCMITLSFERVH